VNSTRLSGIEQQPDTDESTRPLLPDRFGGDRRDYSSAPTTGFARALQQVGRGVGGVNVSGGTARFALSQFGIESG
jgi:hypothetical protein